MKEVSIVIKDQEGYIALNYENVKSVRVSPGWTINNDLDEYALYLQIRMKDGSTATFDYDGIVELNIE